MINSDDKKDVIKIIVIPTRVVLKVLRLYEGASRRCYHRICVFRPCFYIE